MFTDTALAAYEIIRSKREGVLIHTHAHSWLEDADVLVWLAGDYRSLRPGAWIEFQDVAQHRANRQRVYKRLKDSDFVEDHHAFERSAGQRDYAQAERLVLRHMPKHLFNRPVWGGELAEWNICVASASVRCPENLG